jgi:hypothetical protein
MAGANGGGINDDGTVCPDNSCLSPTPATRGIDLGFGRTGDVLPVQVQFQCTLKGLCNAAGACGADKLWTETATVTFLGLNSDTVPDDTPSWELESIDYSAPPAPNPAP